MKITAHFNDGTSTLVDEPTFLMARLAAKRRFPKLHVVKIETHNQPLKLVEANHA